jgi:hypothetical protein
MNECMGLQHAGELWYISSIYSEHLNETGNLKDAGVDGIEVNKTSIKVVRWERVA